MSFVDVMDAHLQNNQTEEDDILASSDRLKGRKPSICLFSRSDVKLSLPVCVSAANQMDAKESDMSDTLSPSKDRSSDDTSGQRTNLGLELVI